MLFNDPLPVLRRIARTSAIGQPLRIGMPKAYMDGSVRAPQRCSNPTPMIPPIPACLV
jgi:hypothetical protein